ncbi:MAG: serine/threonine-protein kinase [Verrucomicrobia bacterium]|nr:serine/threonine-protein kinase [Verrucomicrobiota bacterium]
MPTFKITDNSGAAIRGGANREAGLAKLGNLDAGRSQEILDGLRTNLAGADGLSKHGVLKLRNSSSTGSGMEFARMNGMDRWFSKESTFANTSKALRTLLINSGTKPETADALLKHYGAKDGSIKCKDAITLINRVLPQSARGSTLAESLQNAGIQAPTEAQQDSIQLGKKDDLSQGGFGKIFPATDNGAACIVKRFGNPVEIKLDKSGNLTRGDLMDANHLAAGKVPGTIAPNRYIITKLEPDGGKSFHTVTAGRNFKEFCRLNKGFVPELDDKGNPKLDDQDKPIKRSILELHGIVMDKAKGARMDQVRSSDSEQKEIARGFASILMNASSRGVVFYDIKPDNAFVDGGKLTLIDTDGAFKNSKTNAKIPKPTIAATFLVPTKSIMNANSPHRGMQQDLWCVGISLLEHAGRGGGNLKDVGALEGRDKLLFWTNNDTVEKKFDWLKNRIGGPEPSAGSVEDFALLCIKTALSKHDAPYFKRFTGEGEHLLDPILDHSLIGGRQAFIEKNLVKRELGQSQENLLKPQNIEDDVDSIDDSESEDEGYLEPQVPIKNIFKNEIEDSDEEDDKSLKNDNPEDGLAFIRQILQGGFKNDPRTSNRSSFESQE